MQIKILFNTVMDDDKGMLQKDLLKKSGLLPNPPQTSQASD